MEKDDLYKNLEPGDLILSRKPGIFSLPIRWVTGSSWSHVDIYTGDGWVVGAVWPKVRIAEIKNIPIWSAWRLKNLNPDQRADVAKFGLNKIGVPYDWKLFLFLFWRIVNGTLDKVGDDPAPDKYLCSELVAEACASQGIMLGKYIDNVLPKRIANSPETVEITSKG